MHRKSLTCRCGEEVGTVSHVIYECSIFENIRKSHFPRNRDYISIKNVIENKKSRKGIEEIISKHLQNNLDEDLNEEG